MKFPEFKGSPGQGVALRMPETASILHAELVDACNQAAGGLGRRDAVIARHIGGDETRVQERYGNAARPQFMHQVGADHVYRGF